MNGVTSLVVASVGGPVCFTWCVGFLTLLCPLCCDVMCTHSLFNCTTGLSYAPSVAQVTSFLSITHPPTPGERKVELVVALRLLPEGSSVHWV